MRGHRPDQARTPVRSFAAPLVVLLAAITLLGVAACDSSDGPPEKTSPAAVTTAITRWMPKDASSEPPWNGRFVQVNVRVAEPGKMDPAAWRVFVNGEQPELEKEPSILPFSATEATVAFVFRAPYGDLGTYEFRVVYAPEGGEKVARTWEYRW